MVLDYKDIYIHQGDHLVLKNVNFQVAEGEMIYLTGSVGSGKTSLMKTIYGELPCIGKKAEVMGISLLKIKPRETPALRRKLGIVFQDFKLMPDRTVHHNLNFILRATGWDNKEEREKRIQEVMDQVKLIDKLKKYPYELSGGEQQRVCIARAILNKPKLILADEPTGNLDQENGELILALLDEIRRQNHTALIISTHNLTWPQYFPGTIYRFEEGLMKKENE